MRSLESLKAKYENRRPCADVANEAVAERIEIIHDCDAKGYETEEDTQMMAYLWNIRQIVVGKIIKGEL